MTMFKKLFGRLLCIVGYHRFKWLLSEEKVIYLNRDIPDSAKCERCGIKYKRK